MNATTYTFTAVVTVRASSEEEAEQNLDAMDFCGIDIEITSGPTRTD